MYLNVCIWYINSKVASVYKKIQPLKELNELLEKKSRKGSNMIKQAKIKHTWLLIAITKWLPFYTYNVKQVIMHVDRQAVSLCVCV